MKIKEISRKGKKTGKTEHSKTGTERISLGVKRHSIVTLHKSAHPQPEQDQTERI